MSEQDMREFWASELNLPMNEYNYQKALEIYELPAKAKAALDEKNAALLKEEEYRKWLLAIAIAFFIQRNGAQIINGIAGGISGIVAGFLGLAVI